MVKKSWSAHVAEVLTMQTPESSNIESIEYDTDSHKLTITFKNNNSKYEYDSVPEDVYLQLVNASSKGSFFYHNIRDRYPTRKIQ